MIDRVAETSGEIVTFYSFKGGVGRTMAVANVAFVAAMNGLKVLVMDWDLEAPGLDYYFRGLTDTETARTIKAAPGVLDLAWSWRRDLLQAQGGDDVDDVLEKYTQGLPFSECACTVLDNLQCPKGRLDIIGAGSKTINDGTPLSYPEALARFSWTEFFDQYGGGLFIQRLREWAKREYDLVLIDSRTGFADVAGICTIQLPDTVALSFIYNRQNIEGVGDVARSIQVERQGAVKMRAIPMRTAREGMIEEAEARARAIRRLVDSGGFTTDRARMDIDVLAIRSSGVPFYETLAPFATATPSADPLCLDYTKLTAALIGKPMATIEIPTAWRDSVRRRLEPKTVTIEYLGDLREADAGRTAEELERLLDGAEEAELHEGGVDRDYLIALVDLALDLHSISFDDLDYAEVQRLATKALEMLRTRSDADPVQWAETYVGFLARFHDIFEPGVDDDVRENQLQTYDRILSLAGRNADVMMLRASYRRELAALAGAVNPERGLTLLDEAENLLQGASQVGGPPAPVQWISLLNQRAMMLDRLGRRDEAKAVALRALDHAGDADRQPGLRRLVTALHLLLVRLEADPEAAVHHLDLAMQDETFLQASPGSLNQAVKVLARTRAAPARALQMINRLAPVRGRPSQNPAIFFARTAPYAREFVAGSAALAGIAASQPTDMLRPALDALLKANTSVIRQLIRRYEAIPPSPVAKREANQLLGEVTTLLQIGSLVGVSPETVSALAAATGAFDRTMQGIGAE